MSDEPSLSDHRYIVYRIDSTQETLKTIQNPRNADWNKFRNDLGEKLNYYYNEFRVGSKDDLEVMAAMLDTSIRDSFASSWPGKIIQDKSSMWWTKELNKLRKYTRRKLRVALRQNVPEHWESYRKAQRRYRRSVKQAKINSWRNFCESINKIPELTRLRKILAKDRKAMEEPLRLPNGDLTRTLEVSLGCISGKSLPRCKDYKGPERTLAHSADWYIARKVVMEDRVRWAVNSFMPYKAPVQTVSTRYVYRRDLT